MANSIAVPGSCRVSNLRDGPHQTAHIEGGLMARVQAVANAARRPQAEQPSRNPSKKDGHHGEANKDR